MLHWVKSSAVPIEIVSLILLILGTIRKFLETNQNEIVILCLEQQECGIFEVLAPLYFPRNQLEEKSSSRQLPKDIAEITGELSICDRQIRITRNPNTMMLGEWRMTFSQVPTVD